MYIVHAVLENCEKETKKCVKILKISDKEAKEKEKAAQQLAVPRLSVCADAQKVDRAKLAQTEVNSINYTNCTKATNLSFLSVLSYYIHIFIFYYIYIIVFY